MTTILRQVRAIKRHYPDAIILVPLGDFYEAFEDDAVRLGEIMEIQVLQHRVGDVKVAIAGILTWMLDDAIAACLARGVRVAVLGEGAASEAVRR